MSGVFISKGISPIIKAGDLKIEKNKTGDLIMDVKLSLQYNACPIWLKISIDHLIKAKEWRETRVDAFKGKDDNLKSESIENEFEQSMEAVIALASRLMTQATLY